MHQIEYKAYDTMTNCMYGADFSFSVQIPLCHIQSWSIEKVDFFTTFETLLWRQNLHNSKWQLNCWQAETARVDYPIPLN
jgi:hypothetical protein